MVKSGLRLGCHYCEKSFSSQSSRANHHSLYHPNKHRWMKGHRKAPTFICAHCHLGWGSVDSLRNHKGRCGANPAVLAKFKAKKKLVAEQPQR